MEPSPIHDATIRCLADFEALSSSHTPSESLRVAVEDKHARFRIWAGNLGALQRLPSRAAADSRLQDAPEVSSRILEILEDITETNEDLQSLSDPNDTAASENDDERNNYISELCLSIGDSITSLLKVSALLRKATTRDRYAVAAASKIDALPSQYSWFDEKHVAEKYPKVAKQQPLLCKRLAIAISTRRQYLRYSKRHQQRIANNQHQRTVAAPQAPPVAMPSATLQQRSRLGDNMSLGLTLSAAAASTKASTLQIDRVKQMGIGTSEVDDDDDDNISQATSYVSAASGADNSIRAQVVKLDTLTKNNEPFQCPYCQGIVQYKNQRAWRKHVFRDLRAYACTNPACEAGLFEDRNTWLVHELECHRRVWICLTCPSKTFQSESSFHSHLRAQHGYDDDAVLKSISNSSSRPLAEVAATACPLCDDWAEQLRIPPGEKTTTSVAMGLFKQHLGSHQEQLALFAITPDYEREVDSETDSQKSDVPEDGKNSILANWQRVAGDAEELDNGSNVGYDSDESSNDGDDPLGSQESDSEAQLAHGRKNATGDLLTIDNLRSHKSTSMSNPLLDPEQSVRTGDRGKYIHQPRDFFTIGKVFELWPHSSRIPWDSFDKPVDTSRVPWDDKPMDSPASYMFLVTEEKEDRCFIAPIRTYDGHSVSSFNHADASYAMISSGDSLPMPFREEIESESTVDLSLYPFKLNLDEGAQGLPLMSRIKFGAVQGFPYGTEAVRSVGVLDQHSIDFFRATYAALAYVSRWQAMGLTTTSKICRLCTGWGNEIPFTEVPCSAGHMFHTPCLAMYREVARPDAPCPICRVEGGVGLDGTIPKRDAATTAADATSLAIATSMASGLLCDQIASYFTDENLAGDTELRSLMDFEGWISVYDVAELERFRHQIFDRNDPASWDALVQALLQSSVLEFDVDNDGRKKLRKREGWAQFVLPEDQRDSSRPLLSTVEDGSDDEVDQTQPGRKEQEPILMDASESRSGADAVIDAINQRSNTIPDNMTDLYLACRSGDLDFVKDWRSTHPKSTLDILDYNGNRPLLLAAGSGNSGLVSYLLDQGCAVDGSNLGDITPLMEAALHGHMMTTNLLLDAGANVDHETHESDTPLLLASVAGQLDTVSLLLDRGANIEHHNLQHRTALIYATTSGGVDIVSHLLERGADAQAQDSRGKSPLIVAAEKGSSKMVELLLHAGADTHQRDQEGYFALTRAMEAGHFGVADLLIKAGADEEQIGDALMDATRSGDVEAVQFLLPSASTYQAGDALVLAVQLYHVDLVGRLVAHSSTHRINDALMEGAKRDNVEVVRLLLGFSGTDRIGEALLAAARFGNVKVVGLLRDSSTTDQLGDAIRLAAQLGHLAIVRILLEKSSASQTGSAIIAAAENGHTDAVELLIEAGKAHAGYALIEAAKAGFLARLQS